VTTKIGGLDEELLFELSMVIMDRIVMKPFKWQFVKWHRTPCPTPETLLHYLCSWGNQMTTFLTKAQRQILIDWYIDCLIDTESEFVDGSEEAERQSLASMNNSYFYEYVQEMMPSCMADLAKMKQGVTVA
jgi:predicted alpha-1,6-mannanase (GH76 family)